MADERLLESDSRLRRVITDFSVYRNGIHRLYGGILSPVVPDFTIYKRSCRDRCGSGDASWTLDDLPADATVDARGLDHHHPSQHIAETSRLGAGDSRRNFPCSLTTGLDLGFIWHLSGSPDLGRTQTTEGVMS